MNADRHFVRPIDNASASYPDSRQAAEARTQRGGSVARFGTMPTTDLPSGFPPRSSVLIGGLESIAFRRVSLRRADEKPRHHLAISAPIQYLSRPELALRVSRTLEMEHTLRETCDDLQARILNLRDSL
jgi:hypothetical protein